MKRSCKFYFVENSFRYIFYEINRQEFVLDPISWLYNNKQYFSIEMNGYADVPIGPYLSTLPLIDRNGKILDLGSGNGMLLKFLILFSSHTLDPYGIDIKSDVITQAVEEVLPDYSKNFFIKDTNLYDYKEGPFDIIISNPFYAYPKIYDFISKCMNNLADNGKIIFRIHNDVFRYYNISSIEEISDFKKFPIRISQGSGLTFCTIEK